MQAAIDRVLRSFAPRHPVPLHDRTTDERSRAERDEATAFAGRLLDSYKDQLARRSLARD